MTGAELKSIRESLNLSAQALADMLQAAGLLKTNDERTVRRWEDGTRGARGVPADVAAWVEQLNHQVERQAHGMTVDALLIRWETPEDWARHHPGTGRHDYRLHSAAIIRACQIQARDRRPTARVVSMNIEDYEAWRFQAGREDDEASRLEWAAGMVR